MADGPVTLRSDFNHEANLPVAIAAVANPEFRIIDQPGHPDFPAFYKLYEKIFTLAETRQSPEGFNRIMGYNSDAELQQKFGPFLESSLLMVDPATGELMGAVNFLRGMRKEGQDRDAWGNIDAFNQCTYVFVNPKYRGNSVATKLLDRADETTAEWAADQLRKAGRPVPGKINVVDMFEQDDPLQLTPAQYIEDSRTAGITPEKRLVIFQRMGARTLSDPLAAFKYAQAPIFEPGTPEAERPGAADYLLLTARVPEGANITARFLREGYIPGYFGVWYTGGTGVLEEIADYRRMTEELKTDRAFAARNDLESLPLIEAMTNDFLQKQKKEGTVESETRTLSKIIGLVTLEKMPASPLFSAVAKPAAAMPGRK